MCRGVYSGEVLYNHVLSLSTSTLELRTPPTIKRIDYIGWQRKKKGSKKASKEKDQKKIYTQYKKT